MENIKYCPHCGKQIKATARKCIHCKQWVDGRENGVAKPAAANDGSSSLSVSPVVLIISTLALLVLGVLIYYLAKGDDDKSESYRTEQHYDNSSSRDHDRSSGYYDDDDDDYSSSSRSSYSSSRSGTYTIPCVMCHGSRKGDDGLECRYCLGHGELECDYDYGACRLECGCERYITVHGYDFCIGCMLLGCHANKSDHRSI